MKPSIGKAKREKVEYEYDFLGRRTAKNLLPARQIKKHYNPFYMGWQHTLARLPAGGGNGTMR